MGDQAESGRLALSVPSRILGPANALAPLQLFMVTGIRMWTGLQYRILKRISPDEPPFMQSDRGGRSKLTQLLGEDVLARLAGKRVVDFGCGEGLEAIEMARAEGSEVVGIDLREEILEVARTNARNAGLGGQIRFSQSFQGEADVIVSLDAFEHFANPAQILRMMADMLAPEGRVLVSFGPTWLHPYGGHLFSVFPFAHLIFSEAALIRWRSDIRSDGATTFGEVAGGLNQMTIARFERLVEQSPLQFSNFEAVPIRAVRSLHHRLTREWTTSIVRCELTHRA